MALSNSFDYTDTITAGVACKDALQDAGIVPVGKDPEPEEYEKALRKANLILKQWSGLPNFLVWKRKTASLTLSAKISFDLQPTGGDLDIQVPEEILVATLKQSSNSEIVMQPMTLIEYRTIPNKQDTGTPLKYYYEQQLTKGVLYLDRIPSDITDTIEIAYRQPFNDLDSTGDSIDLLSYWYKAFIDKLTIEVCKAWSRQATQDMYATANESYRLALQHDPETEISFFEPNRIITNGRGMRTNY